MLLRLTPRLRLPNADANRDGTVDLKELGSVLKSMGMDFKGEELDAIMVELDSDGSGSVDFPEFVKMMGQYMPDNDTEEEIREVFRLFCKRKADTISMADLRGMMVRLGDEDCTDEDIRAMMQVAAVRARPLTGTLLH